MEKQIVKSERIEIRVTPDEKALLIEAREIRGDRTFSSFITEILKLKSREIIEEDQRILLSERDRQLFFSNVLSDQEPNQALNDASKLHDSLP